MMAMLSTSTPAAPQIIVGMASECRVGFLFWLEANGGVARLRKAIMGTGNSSSKPQETQEERDAQVARIRIFPGDVTVRIGETIVFSAIAYDAGDVPVSGVSFSWSARDARRDRPVRISKRADFQPKDTGNFIITAEGAGYREQVKVTVLEGEQRKKDDKDRKVREVSTRDSAERAASQPRKERGEKFSAHAALRRLTKAVKSSLGGASATTAAAAPAAPIACDNCGWDDGNYPSADDPGNTVGTTPGGTQDEGAGNGNFQLSAPVLSLPGRGIDITLGLAYNSRLWNKSGSELTYDIDRGWPAPGWNLGFGKVVGMGVNNGSMIVDADGTRHAYSGIVTYGYNNSYTDFVGHTTDGSLIDYSHHTGLGGAMTSARARFPNGTVIEYYTPGTGAMYPSRITDAQGNYITITYLNNTGPNIETVTDTLGRIINFHYDANNLLTAITAPDVAAGTTRTLVRLHYKVKTLSYGFAASITPKVRDASPWVIDAIYYPGTSSGYWFGDTDSYSSYGMIAKVREQRGMTLAAASLNVQGTVTKGTETRESAYNYAMTANSTLTDAPTYTTKTDTWHGMDTAASVTSYLVQQNANPRKVTITYPNGSKNIQYSYNAPGQYNDGLVYQDETYGPGDTTPMTKSTVTWEAGAYDTARPARTEVTDERLQKTATEFDYGPVYNQVTEVRDYDFGGTALLRKVVAQYENSTNYTNRHIFNLVKQVEIYAANGTTRESRTEYVYDGGTLKDTPGVVQHEESSNPHAQPYWVEQECEPCDLEYKEYCQPCIPAHWESAYNPATDYRGNVTQTKTYTDAATLTGPITGTHTYDITGNLVTSSSSCCEQTSYNYTSATKYGYPLSETRGSATDTAQQVKTSATYSLGTGLVLTSTDANGRITRADYFAETLRIKKVTLPTGAHTLYDSDDSAMTTTETTYLSGGIVIANQNVKHLNGLGQVSREEALTREAGVDYWDVVETQYDQMGRTWKQSRPYRSGQTPLWSETFYDDLGRINKVKAPDGSESKAFYNEATRPATASTTPGQTTRLVDAWGRERWGRSDARGRLAEVIESDPAGNGLVMGTGASAASLVTKYSYDTLDNLTLVTQGSQQRKFDYDSLGRLTRQKLAEASATLDDAGIYAGVGTGGKWSDVMVYDARSNLTSHIDARGVKAIFTYSNDPLNRLQSVTYNIAGVGAIEQEVAPAPKVTYTYMAAGDLTRLDTVTTAGVSTENYDYDVEGRISTATLTLTSRAAYPMLTSYVYDTLDRVKDVRYPAQYGQLNDPRKLVHQDYDVASRLSTLKYDGATYASELIYNPASQTTEMKVGAANANQITETYGYDAKTGLLNNQKVVRGAETATPATLMNLSYSYLRTGTTTGQTGQLTKITNHLNQQKNRYYEYDALGRLERATGGSSATTPLWTQSYTYDRYGNRTSVVATGTAENGSAMVRDGLTGLTYGAATNRVTGFTYDSAGNQIRAKRSDGVWQRYEYDAAGRLVKVKDDTGATIASYKYGSLNKRLVAYDGDETSPDRTYYSWSGNAVVAEYIETSDSPSIPQWAKSYVYLGERLLATVMPNGGGQMIQYHHPDRLGTRLITNAADTTVEEQVTLPFGTALDAESTGATNRRFTSYDRSATTKLDYAVNRHYDSGQGRFTQVDPLGMGAVSLADPQTLNMYAYCANDPINNIDPDGLFFGKLFSAIGKFFKKVLKWIAIAIAVVIAVAIVAAALSTPGGAGALFASFLMEAIVKPAVALLGALTGVSAPGIVFGPGGTPVWNPNQASGLGSGTWRQWATHLTQVEDDVIRVTTSCKNNYPLPDGPNCPGGKGLLRRARDLMAGLMDEGMLFGSLQRGLLESVFGFEGADTNSTEYKRGGQVVYYGSLLIPGGGPVRGAGLGARFIRKHIVGIIPAKGQNIGRGVQILGGRIKYMKHAAHKIAHTLPHHQIEIGKRKIRHIIGTPIWRWTTGRF